MGETARIQITYTAMGCPATYMIEEDMQTRLLRLPGVAECADRDGLGAGLDQGAPDCRGP